MTAVAVRDAQPAPDAVRPPPGNPRFALLDSVRAIAAVAVLVSHVAGVTGFNFHTGGAYAVRLTGGVALFFVLSGFLIYRPFVAARLDGRARPRVPTYARRRALRIIPAYWLALTILTIWPGVPGNVFGHPLRYYLFLQWTSLSTVFGGITPAWSLAVEVSSTWRCRSMRWPPGSRFAGSTAIVRSGSRSRSSSRSRSGRWSCVGRSSSATRCLATS